MPVPLFDTDTPLEPLRPRLNERAVAVLDAGGKYLAGRPEPGATGDASHSYYEAKYKDPLGIVFDLTHTGWIGAVKDVVPAKN